MTPWQRFFPRRALGTRLVLAVVAAMSVVLVLAGALVYWRVGFALDRQLDQDLRASRDVAQRTLRDGRALAPDAPGQVVQVYSTDGLLLQRSDEPGGTGGPVPRLAGAGDVRRAAAGTEVELDLGRLLPASRRSYRVSLTRVPTPSGPRVVAVAVSRRAHDEALRELLLQLGLTDLLAVVAAGFVGWGTVRAALGPVERYRRAAEEAGHDPVQRLPVDASRDDELTRLGHTFNDLLARVHAGHVRERGFLADAAHELRSPLALLSAEIEWAAHRPRTPEQMAEVMASLGSQVDRLVDLSNALLDLEELRGEDRDPAVERVDLAELLESVAAGWRRTAAEAGRDLEVAAPAGAARLDRRWVGLALGNLVGNALKHGRGTVRLQAETRAGDRVRFTVRDEGGGIPDELGDRAFDRFTRGDVGRTTRGSGLGLALVRAVAESGGGSVERVPGGVAIEVRHHPPADPADPAPPAVAVRVSGAGQGEGEAGR